jgi:hypothetical protein
MTGVNVNSPDSTESDAAVITVPVDMPSARPLRALKLVMSLQPRDGQSYRALVALGADGCDPLFRSIDADALTEALALIPPLIAEAEARWQTQPRYPSARPSKTPKSAPASGHPTAAPSPDTSTPRSADTAPAESTSGTKPTGQLPLFG